MKNMLKRTSLQPLSTIADNTHATEALTVRMKKSTCHANTPFTHQNDTQAYIIMRPDFSFFIINFSLKTLSLHEN